MFSWFHFLTYALITAGTPGPNNIASMSNASQVGLKKSLPFNLGILTGFCIITVVCTAFFNLLAVFIPVIELPMLIIGAAYMLYLAWATFKSSPDIKEKQTHAGFVSGLLLQFINPKLYIYFIVSMEVYIMPYFKEQPLILFGFALFLAFLGCAFNILWAAFGSAFRWLFFKHARVINTIMALLLVYCSVSLFL
jgi:threonine/homoserine/homoserine lactone efflux protein